MKVVAVVGVMGGAGGTSVVANLAAGLAARQRQALCFDFCPDNLLGLHLGLPWHEPSGLAPSICSQKPWHDATFRGSSNVDFVPFGQLANEADLEAVTQRLREQPSWFRSQLTTLHVSQDTVVICDCPRGYPALRDQILRVADLVLLVCAPDPVSYAFATKMLANGSGAPPTYIVLNGFDAARRLDRDVAVLLRSSQKKHLSPVVVHRDESVREALACKQTVDQFAPSSQAAYDFGALATWVAARLGHAESSHGL